MSLEMRKRNEEVLSSKLEQAKSLRLFPQLYGCLFIDMSWMDMIYAFSCILSRGNNYQEVQGEIESLLGGPERILISLSVRSAFDLFFQAMRFPPESELISTCINIKQMSEIAKYHGVYMKAVDIDLSNLKPNVAQIESLITEKTVGIMVVQLFGMKFNTKELKDVAKKHDLLLIEDCAQAFYGPDSLHKVDSDIAFFSFGSIKRFTCLGGACIVCNNASVVQKMRQVQSTYTVQGRSAYFYKLLKYVVFMAVMNNPFISWFLSSLVSKMGIDYKVLVKSRLRSFTKGHFFEMIRYQPSISLLLLLRRRMKNLLEEEVNLGANLRAEYAVSCLIEKPTYVIGCLSEIRDFWLFPVLVDNPIEVERELDKLGISSFAKASSLECSDTVSQDLSSSQFLCKHVLYLPVDRRVPKTHIDNVCRCLMLVLQNRESIFEMAKQEGVQLKRDLDTLLRYTSQVSYITEQKSCNDILDDVV